MNSNWVTHVAAQITIKTINRMHFNIVRQRTETTHQPGWSKSSGYCPCCLRVASTSTRLRSCWRRTFWTHAVL